MSTPRASSGLTPRDMATSLRSTAAPGSPAVRFLTQQFASRLLPTTELANRLEARVLDARATKELPAAARADLRAILAQLRAGPEAERIYYLGKLRLLLNTPYKGPAQDGPASELEQQLHAAVDASLKEYSKQLASGAIDPRREEALSEGKRKWTRRTGADGKTYRVDATRLDAIVVKVKVKLTFVHCEYMKQKIPLLEDAIEKAASARGYDVDLTFSKRSGPDVFEVEVDDRVWPNQANWADGAEVLAHELCHVLGLDDRYDRIEAHADNRNMSHAERLYWFREELRKRPDPRGDYSKLGDHAQPLLSEDVCAIVQDASAACLEARIPLDPPGVPQQAALPRSD
jgi:hypothetical protein